MNPSLFAPSPRRKRGLILTLLGSLLFHGSLIGVAAWWPTHPIPEDKPIVSDVSLVDPPPLGDPLPPAVPPSDLALDTPVPVLAETVENPPLVVEPDTNDMVQSTPLLHPAARTLPSRSVAVSLVPRTVHTQGNSLASGAAAGGSGTGHLGTPARWVTPRPAYSAALRMAHVQGSGSVRVTTDAAGRVISAVVVKSTGNSRLDENTCQAAKSEWSGPPNSTTLVPISYQLQ